MLARLLFLFTLCGFAISALAQTGHPAKGSWSGDLDHGSTDPTRIRLLIDAINGELSGTVNPGRRGIIMEHITLDPETWTITIQANMPDGQLMLIGTLHNLGSWTNRKYTGTYTLNDRQGDFEFTLN